MKKMNINKSMHKIEDILNTSHTNLEHFLSNMIGWQSESDKTESDHNMLSMLNEMNSESESNVGIIKDELSYIKDELSHIKDELSHIKEPDALKYVENLMLNTLADCWNTVSKCICLGHTDNDYNDNC